MAVLTKGPTLGDLVKWEVYPAYTREVITLLAGTSYPLGAVLGKILILVLIILFIQRRPRGLFALKGRAIEQ